jgi:hypothetical protein
MRGPGPVYAQDEIPGHICSKVGKIKRWRDENRVRVPNGRPAATITVSAKPGPAAQLPWRSYQFNVPPYYEMIAVNFLVEYDQRAQPLVGKPREAELKQVTIKGRRMVHFHNIERMARLADSHPWITKVEKHNSYKQYDPSEFDETGRATKFHQSPWDLKFRLEFTGASMYVGYTVNGARAGMANIWWHCGSGLQNHVDREMARIVFYDIAEAEHKETILGDYWRQAWETVGPEEEAEDEDDGATQPGSAQAHPASRGSASDEDEDDGSPSVTPSQHLRPQPPDSPPPPQLALAAAAPDVDEEQSQEADYDRNVDELLWGTWQCTRCGATGRFDEGEHKETYAEYKTGCSKCPASRGKAPLETGPFYGCEQCGLKSLGKLSTTAAGTICGFCGTRLPPPPPPTHEEIQQARGFSTPPWEKKGDYRTSSPRQKPRVELRSRQASASSNAASGARKRTMRASTQELGEEGRKKKKSPSPRRRSRSRTRPVSPMSVRSTSDKSSGGPADVDRCITQRHTQKSIKALPDVAKAELRTYRKQEGKGCEYQKKFSDFHWHKYRKGPASGGKKIAGFDEDELEEKRGAVYSKLAGFSNPCPRAHHIFLGIKHHGDKKKDQGKLWNVPRALASNKHKHLQWLSKNLDGKGCSASGGFLFNKLWPDTGPPAHGQVPLTKAGLRALRREGLAKTDYDVARHLIQLHDGEARLTYNRGFDRRFPDNDVDVQDARFWSYQFARTGPARKFLEDRHKEHGELRLSEAEILKVLKLEGNETTILRWEPDPGIDPASGGNTLESGTWYIRGGNYLTLAELFYWGAKECTCFHLYKMYLSLDYYIYKRTHSESMPVDAQRTRAAKNLHHQEHGTWSLPKEGDSWNEPKRRRRR